MAPADGINPGQDANMIEIGDDVIFILGNGPSLAGVDLKALSSKAATLGMNAAYRYWREINWRPRYYACLDLVVGLSHKDEIAAMIRDDAGIEAFLLRSNLIDALGDAALDPRVVNFDALRLHQPMLADEPVTTGSHAALWAANLGFKTMVIAGVDGNYREIVDGARPAGGIELEIVDHRENPNYFFDGYQRPGDRYNVPNPRPGLHTGAWKMAASHLAAAGVRIANANADSAVRDFAFVDLDQLLAAGRATIAGEGRPTSAIAPVAPKSERVDAGAKLREFVTASRKPLAAGIVLGAVLSLAAVMAGTPLAFGAAMLAQFLILMTALAYV
ncbi:MAG: hypothetical protein KDA46_15255, partial [Parvularculaceae bacterium]|nr:hypothetical protein [Parvularculaceae bacterium]